MAEINLRIDGMHCGSCIRRVTQSLNNVPGTTVEEVRLGAARVQVTDAAAAPALVAAIGKAGFTATLER